MFCREMVDIELFLRDTAEKEAEAKTRLQVALNPLMLPLLKGVIVFGGSLGQCSGSLANYTD